MSVNMQRSQCWPSHDNLGYYPTQPHTHVPLWTPSLHLPLDNRAIYVANYPPSSNRVMRNMAEKMRRDKLNFFINELSTLVPIISFSPKKLDKTSILRLAATYIRLHNVIFGSVRRDSRRSSAQAAVHRQMLEYLPQYLASFNWSENVLEEMDGMLMIVNGAGRIIFISHTVEKLLGHTQIELMGQSLYNLTCLEDYDELKRNLAPDDDPTNTAPSGDATGDESSCDSSSGPATPPPRLPTLPFHLDSEGSDQRLRRSFYIRLRQRAQSRSDQPQYELVHVVGHLRVPPRLTQPSTSHQPPNHNDVVLVAVVKPFKEKRITTLSLMEACREEFITRHTLDGRIIYTDHRISIVAGYLAEEVCGIPGFQYMHKEDMRWTMIGLRQMFFRGSSYGQSCYRLQTKNGSFIYLKTCGYLELSENNDSFQSLICINSLVTETEGEALINKMKEQFSPVIKNKSDRNMEILSSNIQEVGKKDIQGETEDPQVLQAAITQMITNVPTASFDMNSMHSPTPSSIDPSEPQFAKATLAAKAMPPLSIQIKKIGIVPPIIRTPAALAASLSPPSSHHSPGLKASPPRPQSPPQVQQQNRPSVLRVAHRGREDHEVLQPQSSLDHCSVSVLKRLKTDEHGQEVVMSRAQLSPRGVVVSPVGAKRKSDESSDWPQVSPTPSPPLLVDVSLSPVPPNPTPTAPLSPTFHLDAVEQLFTAVDDNDILADCTMFQDDVSPPSLASNLEDIGLPADVYGLAFWNQPEMPEMIESSHRTLDSRIQLQGDQIHEIQQELDLVPTEHTNGQVYNTKLTQLQVEHRKQQQMLKTLQQDHQSIQHLGVCNSQQNVGV